MIYGYMQHPSILHSYSNQIQSLGNIRFATVPQPHKMRYHGIKIYRYMHEAWYAHRFLSDRRDFSFFLFGFYSYKPAHCTNCSIICKRPYINIYVSYETSSCTMWFCDFLRRRCLFILASGFFIMVKQMTKQEWKLSGYRLRYGWSTRLCDC